MIDPEHKLSIGRQAKLLGFSRGSVYYLPRPVSDGDLALLRRIDELHLDFAGSRMSQGLLRGEGLETGRLNVATLMKKMGIESIYRRPNTSKPAPRHKIYPYLLRKLAGHPAQPGLGNGHQPRHHGVGLRLSLRCRRLVRSSGSVVAAVDTMEAAFGIEAIEEALARHGQPDILNTDQVSQFTFIDFTRS